MTTPTEIYNWYKRYKVLAADMTELQSQVLNVPAGLMEGIFAGSILSGLEAATTGGMSVQVNTGIAVGPTGYFHVLESITTVNLTAPTGSNPARSLIVARPSLTDSDFITNPTNPFDTVPLRTTLGSAITLLPGTAASSPSYPGTESNDVVICGVRTYPGQTSITVADIDLTVRDNVAKNSSGLQNAAQFDDRLRPYRLTNQILGVRPSQLSGSNQKQFKASANNRAAIFPKTPAGSFNANDTFLNFQSGAITGGDGATGSFTPQIPSAGNCIVATVVLTTSNTLSVSYGTAGTRAQCVAGIFNQTGSGAGSVSIPTTGQPIAFVLVSSSNGSTVTEIDFFDARGILQGGGGGGGDTTFINYFTDPLFASTPIGTVPENFSLYNDGATAVPIDGTGGTVTGVTFVASDTDPIRGTASGLLTKDASNRQGVGLGYLFSIPDIDKSTLTLVRWELETSSAYVAGDIVCYVYDVTNSVLITPSVTSMPALTGNGNKTQYTFLLGTGSQYRLLWHIATTNASAYTVKFDTMVCSTTPQVVQANAEGPYESVSSYTIGAVTTAPTPGSGATFYRNTFRDIDWAIIRFEYNQSALGVTGSGDYLFPLPSGLNIDYTRLGPTGAVTTTSDAGNGSVLINATPYMAKCYALNSGAYANKILVTLYNDTTSGTPWGSGLGGLGSTATIRASFTVRVPIAEWAGSGINLGPGAQVTYWSDDGSADVLGPNGALVPNVAFSTGTTARVISIPSKSIGQLLSLEINYRGNGWAPASDVFPYSIGNNASSSNVYGIQGVFTSATTYQVAFGNQGTAVSASNVSNGVSSWATEFAAGTRFRLVEANPSAPVGFGIASQANGPGLINYAEDDTSLASVQWDPNGGGANSSSFAVKCTRVGRIVTITFPRSNDATGAGGTTTALVLSAVLPTLFRPLSAIDIPVFIYHNAALEATPGLIEISSAGVITVLRTSTGTAFGTGQCGLERTSITFTV